MAATPSLIELRSAALRGARGLIAPVLLLVLWQFVISPAVDALPPPSVLAPTMAAYFRSSEFLTSLLASTARVLAGFGLGAALGIGFGILIGLSRTASQLFDPLAGMLRPIAPVAWIPLAIIWFGLSERATIFLIAYTVMFPVLLNTIAGVQSVRRVHLEAARTLGARRLRVAWEVVLPAALPSIFVGLRVGMGLSWAVLVASELIIGYTLQLGLGYILIRYSQIIFNVPRVMAVIVALGLLGSVTDLLLRGAERRFVPWKTATQLR